MRAMLMRGGTSKGLYLLQNDLPEDALKRDALLLRLMGSPDPRQIDGLGGAHPLTSKVAIVSRASDGAADVDYLFLQVGVEHPTVSDQQNCGNLLAGVGPFAVERGLVTAIDPETTVRIRMLNTDSIAYATFSTDDGRPIYDGDTTISGVPGAASPIRLDFEDIAGGTCGALLPTGNVIDTVRDTRVTCIDNGMPVVAMLGEDFGISGTESCAELEANEELTSRIEQIRLDAGHLMNLGDVTHSSVPKLTLVSPPTDGGSFSTRTFIPHRCHDAIGVLGAVSVATAVLIPGSSVAGLISENIQQPIVIEHPTGSFEAVIDADFSGQIPDVKRAGIIRTARKLMDGEVFS
jgi:4-oxalomesaconate tautomerase